MPKPASIGKSKQVKGTYFTVPMASGGGQMDLVFRVLDGWVGFQLGSSKKDLYTAFDGTENRQKRPGSAQNSVPSKSRAREGQDTRELQGIDSSFRRSRRIRERDRLASGAVNRFNRVKNW